MNKENQIILYQDDNEITRVSVRFSDEDLWLAQGQLVEIYQTSKSNVSEHIKHIFEDGELTKETTVRKFRTVQIEGSRKVEREVEHYNLDMVIALGYRVQSQVATRFRIWATGILKEYIIKGFAMDDERLKQGKTAAEIVYNQAGHTKENMGLTTWKKAPNGRVQKSDTIVAKNYLSEDELSQLNTITTSFLDLAESRARRHIITTMDDWKQRLLQFLATMDYDAKSSAGKVSQEEARDKAYSEYEKFKVIQDRSYISDFDRFNNGNDDDTPLLPFDIDPKEE